MPVFVYNFISNPSLLLLLRLRGLLIVILGTSLRSAAASYRVISCIPAIVRLGCRRTLQQFNQRIFIQSLYLVLLNLLQLLRARVVSNNYIVGLAGNGLSEFAAVRLDELLCGLSAQGLRNG
jgi:hypothetical protein